MTKINIFTENIYEAWKIDEKDVIEKSRKILEWKNISINYVRYGFL